MLDRKVTLSLEEIAFIGRPMADLLEHSRKPLPLNERVRRQEEVEELLIVRGPIVNYDPRYGDPGDIQAWI